MRFAACAATQAIIAWTCHLKNHKDDNEEQISPYPLLMSDLPADDRPRERLERIGPAALSTPELIAILLRTGVQGNSATAVATRLLDRYGGMLDRLARAHSVKSAHKRG